VPFDVYLNVAVGGILTGLVYGLMALGLSVIFGVVRVVNFAHGEMMTIAMFIAVLAFAGLHLDPLILLIPIAAVMFVFGYVLQRGLINPFVTRPEHTQFLLLVALAIIVANVLLIVFGPDARSVQTSYTFDSFQVGPLIVDAAKVYAAAAAIVFTAALFAFFRFTLVGKAIRACADNHTGALVVGLDVKQLYALTFGLGAACVGAAGTMMVLIVDAAKVYAAAAAIVFTAALFAFFRFTLVGTAIRACADNHTGALVVGLDVKRLYALTFGLGAACVGAAGTMMVLLIDATPMLGPSYTLLAFVIVITGGLGSMPGALLGGVLIGVTEALAGLLFTPSAKSMFAFGILVLVLLFRPQGLLGKRLT